jgi:hypothetical protein
VYEGREVNLIGIEGWQSKQVRGCIFCIVELSIGLKVGHTQIMSIGLRC